MSVCVSVCVSSWWTICLVILLVLLSECVLVIVLNSTFAEESPPHSKFSLYRHAAVAADAAPCSIVGTYVTIVSFIHLFIHLLIHSFILIPFPITREKKNS